MKYVLFKVSDDKTFIRMKMPNVVNLPQYMKDQCYYAQFADNANFGFLEHLGDISCTTAQSHNADQTVTIFTINEL